MFWHVWLGMQLVGTGVTHGFGAFLVASGTWIELERGVGSRLFCGDRDGWDILRMAYLMVRCRGGCTSLELTGEVREFFH